MIDKSVIAKIRKCLALSKSANEHEAASALAKARALMAEHGVEDDFIALADIEECTARGSRTVSPPRWESLLSATVCRAMQVQVVIDANLDRLYIGRGARPEVAAYAFIVLYRQLKAVRKDYIRTTLRRCKPGRKRTRADIFCEGWASAVYRKIAVLYPEYYDVDVAQYVVKTIGETVPVTVRSPKIKGAMSEDWWRGRARGNAVDLHRGVRPGEHQLVLT